MRLNWGKGIVTLYIVFVSLVIVMVIVAMTKRVDLVADNYYDKEIKYQQQIDREKSTQELDGSLKIDYFGNFILLKFSGNSDYKKIKGEILFYKPSDSRRDFTLPLALDSSGEQKVITNKFEKGLWKVKVNWTLDEKEYYTESVINIY
jgi:hypothetical protein